MFLIHAPKARHAFLILGHGPIWQYASIDFTYYETILHQVWLWTVSQDLSFFSALSFYKIYLDML